ncbi:oligosaccharide flippase family protein [Streptomyces sp. NPDC023723]|uniref:lipopolysaccharide biosynthesis protein n=1 Tax=Streptomyces sp. NPDC023723 TaxID=3154323 RepID=UPI0033D8CFA3
MPKHSRPRAAPSVYRNSLFVLTTTATTALLGFLFWVVVARFYTPVQVGIATSLISAMSLISYLSQFGLNSTLVRFPAASPDRNAQLTLALCAVAGAGGLLALGYLAGLPWYGEKLLFVRENPLAITAFVLLCAFAALNQLAKSVFTGARAPQLNVLSDGLAQGLVKLALPVCLTGFGMYGVVGSTGAGFAAAVVCAVFLMRRRLGFRFEPRWGGTRLREQFGYSLASYASGLLNLVPQLVLPLIVLHQLGAAATGYFYVAFQIAALLNAIAFSVGEALFAEGSHDPGQLPVLLRRTAVIIAAAQTPAAAVIAVGSGLVLWVFGPGYADAAGPLLVAFALGSLAVALSSWANFALKVTRQLRQLIVNNAVFALVTLGLALWWADRGLVWIGWAWGAGNLASGLVAVTALLRGRRGQSPSPGRTPPGEAAAAVGSGPGGPGAPAASDPYGSGPAGAPEPGGPWPSEAPVPGGSGPAAGTVPAAGPVPPGGPWPSEWPVLGASVSAAGTVPGGPWSPDPYEPAGPWSPDPYEPGGPASPASYESGGPWPPAPYEPVPGGSVPPAPYEPNPLPPPAPAPAPGEWPHDPDPWTRS